MNILKRVKHFIYRDYNGFIIGAMVLTLITMNILVSTRGFFLLIFILLCGLIIIQDFYLDGTPLNTWRRHEHLDKIEHLILPNINIFVKGACGGSIHSRERIHREIYKWALARMAHRRDVSEEYITTLMKSTKEFKAFARDDVITRFMLSDEGSAPPNIDYRQWISSVIDRVEAWK